jgi:hypothetical protein
MTLQVSDAREDSLQSMLKPLPNIEKLNPHFAESNRQPGRQGNSLQMGIQ